MLTRMPHLVLVASIVCALSCAPYETQTVQKNQRPDPSRQAQAQHEQKPGDLTGEAKVSGNSVNVLVQKTTLCRDMTTTPMIADTTSAKKLTSTGRGTQYLLAGGAVVLAGAGAYMIGGPCKKTDTDAAGKDVERNCTSQEKKDQKNGGVGLVVVGGAAGAMFVVNLFRTQDSQEVGPTQPSRAETPWKQCETSAAANVTVTLSLRGAQRTALTDQDGIARFELADEEPPRGIDETPITDARVGNVKVADVDLSRLDVFPQWKERLRAERAARDERTRADEEQRQAAAKAEQARLEALAAKCNGGDAQVCYQLGRDRAGAGVRGSEVWFRKACELNYQAGCVAYQKALDDKREAEARQRAREAQRALEAAQQAANDPWQRARRSVLVQCLLDNGGTAMAEGLCKQMLDKKLKPLVERSCIELCKGDKMGDCDRRCTRR